MPYITNDLLLRIRRQAYYLALAVPLAGIAALLVAALYHYTEFRGAETDSASLSVRELLPVFVIGALSSVIVSGIAGTKYLYAKLHTAGGTRNVITYRLAVGFCVATFHASFYFSGLAWVIGMFIVFYYASSLVVVLRVPYHLVVGWLLSRKLPRGV